MSKTTKHKLLNLAKIKVIKICLTKKILYKNENYNTYFITDVKYEVFCKYIF